MFGFNVRTRQNANNNSPRTPRGAGSPATSAASPRTPRSPSTAVGEIDTRAPFQSVRAAVNLFGDAASPKGKPVLIKKTKTAEETREDLLTKGKPAFVKKTKIALERVLEKETQLHWTLKELDKFKESLKAAESTKAQARRELEKANRTLQELTGKLEIVSESRQAAIEATEAAKARAREIEEIKSNKNQVSHDDAWKEDVDSEREHYKVSAGELILVKQELTNLKQDFDAALEAKLTAFQQSADAQHVAKVNREKLGDLSSEVASMRQTLSQVKVASSKAEEDHLKIMAEKEARVNSYIDAKEETEKKIQSLKDEYDNLELAGNGNLKQKLEEATEAVKVIQEQIKEVHDADMELLRVAELELDEAKRRLQDFIEEESSHKRVVETLNLEMENLKREISEMKENESNTEGLQEELEKSKAELKEVVSAERKAESEVNELQLKLKEVIAEAEKARRETEGMNREAEELLREAEASRIATKEGEEKLEMALKEVEAAKAAEEFANDQMHKSSKRHNDSEGTSSGSDGKIKLSTEEFEALSKKVEEVRSSADIKVATAMAQVDAINERNNETLQKLQRSLKEIEDTETAINEALKMAEMADAAKQAIECELRKRSEKDLTDGECSSIHEDD